MVFVLNLLAFSLVAQLSIVLKATRQIRTLFDTEKNLVNLSIHF